MRGHNRFVAIIWCFDVAFRCFVCVFILKESLSRAENRLEFHSDHGGPLRMSQEPDLPGKRMDQEEPHVAARGELVKEGPVSLQMRQLVPQKVASNC